MLLTLLWLLPVPNLDHRLLPPHQHPRGKCRWVALGFHQSF